MPNDDRRLVQVRLPDDLVRAVDHLAIEWDVFRGEAMERLLRQALAALEPAPAGGGEEVSRLISCGECGVQGEIKEPAGWGCDRRVDQQWLCPPCYEAHIDFLESDYDDQRTDS